MMFSEWNANIPQGLCNFIMTAPLHCWRAVKVKDDDLQLIPSGLTPHWLPLLAARHHLTLNRKTGLQDTVLFTGPQLLGENTKKTLQSFCVKN